jgi:predicted nucleic acid-binding protein
VAYLLDSDILIDMSRGNVPAGHYVNSLGDWSLSIVSGMELVAGAKDKREVASIDIMLGAYKPIQISPEISELAYNLMKSYSKANGLDPCDALIAATAIHEGLRLSTKNDKHFRNIGGLDVEVPGYKA